MNSREIGRVADAATCALPGSWRGVAAEHLAPALAAFFTGG